LIQIAEVNYCCKLQR